MYFFYKQGVVPPRPELSDGIIIKKRVPSPLVKICMLCKLVERNTAIIK